MSASAKLRALCAEADTELDYTMRCPGKATLTRKAASERAATMTRVARALLADIEALEADRELLRAYGAARAAYEGPGCRQHDLPESDTIAARADALVRT